MISILDGGPISISVDSRGAELASIADRSGREYLWQGNPAFWSGRAPLLFPVIGALKAGEYSADGVKYRMNQHGFARKMDFALLPATDSLQLSYLLAASPETLAVYPYRFELEVSYRLAGEDIHIYYTVRNRGITPMPFSIGAHPGFSLKWLPDDRLEDYYLEFEKEETVNARLLDADKMLSGESEMILASSRVFSLGKGMFRNDAYILSGLASNTVTLRSRRIPNSVTVDFSGFPYLGIWSKPDAPFICIEPWHGHADTQDHNGRLQDKPGIMTLAPAGTFSCRHTISIRGS